jgi:hypothetical protein
MFDPLFEKPLTFAQAAKLDIIPRRRQGRPIHPSCIARWAAQGIDDIRLEALKVGRTWCTSREALARFFQRLTDASNPDASAAARRVSSRQHDRVQQVLDQAGI